MPQDGEGDDEVAAEVQAHGLPLGLRETKRLLDAALGGPNLNARLKRKKSNEIN